MDAPGRGRRRGGARARARARARTGRRRQRGGRGIVPTRTCIGCRRAQPADGLVRVARRADGSLTLERGTPGRGAWLCRGSLACMDLAVRRKAFDRAFAAPVRADEAGRLRAQLGGSWGDHTPDVRG